MNSSYVLISTTPFYRIQNGWSTSSDCPGKCIILLGMKKTDIDMLIYSWNKRLMFIIFEGWKKDNW